MMNEFGGARLWRGVPQMQSVLVAIKRGLNRLPPPLQRKPGGSRTLLVFDKHGGRIQKKVRLGVFRFSAF